MSFAYTFNQVYYVIGNITHNINHILWYWLNITSLPILLRTLYSSNLLDLHAQVGWLRFGSRLLFVRAFFYRLAVNFHVTLCIPVDDMRNRWIIPSKHSHFFWAHVWFSFKHSYCLQSTFSHLNIILFSVWKSWAPSVDMLLFSVKLLLCD